MNTTVLKSGVFTIVNIEGRVDTTNAGEFESDIAEAVDNGTNILILNCSGLNYISSSGLRVFLIIHKRLLAKNGELRLCSLQTGIKEIFDISGFSSIFSIYPDQESAVIE
jgi:anti-anti-sigma factor